MLTPFLRSGFTLCLAIALGTLAVSWSPGQDQPVKEEAQDAAQGPKKETEGSKKLWGALIYAVETADAKREGFPEVDPKMAAMLSRVFQNYSHFQLLGTDAEAIFKTTHSWVAPSRELCVKFDSKGPTKDGQGVKLDLQLWSRDKAIVKTDAVFKPGSPVFIEGPQWGRGRLLYVLKLQDGNTATPDEKASG